MDNFSKILGERGDVSWVLAFTSLVKSKGVKTVASRKWGMMGTSWVNLLMEERKRKRNRERKEGRDGGRGRREEGRKQGK